MKLSKILLTLSFSCFSLHLLAQPSQDVESSPESGKLIFEQNCLACHQADGSGVPGLAPPLIKGVFVNGDKQRLIKIVLEGLQGVEIRGEHYANPMPAFGYLSDKEVADVLTYVRTSFSNKGEAVTPKEVAGVRSKK